MGKLPLSFRVTERVRVRGIVHFWVDFGHRVGVGFPEGRVLLPF